MNFSHSTNTLTNLLQKAGTNFNFSTSEGMQAGIRDYGVMQAGIRDYGVMQAGIRDYGVMTTGKAA